MQKNEAAKILSNTKITQRLDQANLEELLNHSQVKKVEKGRVVITEGQPGETLYVVLSGRLKVLLLKDHSGNNPNRITDICLNTLRQGDCFGEYSLIDLESASASVVAVEPTELVKITRSNFESMAANNDRMVKDIYCNLLHILVKRLRKKDKELDLNLDVFEQEF